MSHDDHVRRVLQQLAADEVDELVASARQRAREIVLRRLVDDYASALLDAVAASALPARRADLTGTNGCYVYAVTGGPGASAATGELGISPGGQVDVVAYEDVAAVVSDVDVDAVRSGVDEADVSADGWLANAVRAHDHVVAAAFRSAPTVPVRFGVIYPDRDAVVAMLREHRRELRQELDRLDGRAEWNVKVFVDLASTSTEAEVAPVSAAGSPGVDFLTRERDRRSARARAELRARTVIADTMQALDRIATDRVDLKHTASGPGGAPYFAATYLVDKSAEGDFVAAVEQQQADCDVAVTLTVDGPWPPFHFTSLRLEPDDE